MAMLISFSTKAQENYSIIFSPFMGKIVTHQHLRLPDEGYQWGFASEIKKETFGKKYWQFAHGFPNMGLRFEYQNLGHYVYGSALSMVPFLEFDVFEINQFSLTAKHGTGIGLATKKFHYRDNPSNQLISTTLNACTFLEANAIYTFRHMDFKLGFYFHHLSNGGFLPPNAGMNTLNIAAGVAYFPNRQVLPKKDWTPLTGFKWLRYRLGMSVGVYEESKLNMQGNALIFFQHNSRFRTGAGIEVGYLFANEFKTQPAVYLEEEVQFSKVATRYGFGYYLANPRRSSEKFYSKIGIAYFPFTSGSIPEKLYIGAMLKAHNFAAAHIELNTGWTF